MLPYIGENVGNVGNIGNVGNVVTHNLEYSSSQLVGGVIYDTQALRSFSIFIPPCKTTMATSKSFLSVASNILNALPNHLSSIPTLPAFRRALKLKHHLFLLAYPDSSVKSGKIKPAQCITLRDTPPTTSIAQPRNTMPPILRRSI